MKTSTILLALSLPLLPACVFGDFGWTRVTQSVEHQDAFESEGLRHLRVECENGPITVRRGEGPILCSSRLSANGENFAEAEELAKAMSVRSERNGSEMRIYVDAPEKARNHEGWAASLKLTVPADLTLDLDAANGRIEVQDPFPGVRAESSNGAIVVHSNGDTWIRTSNGSVKLFGHPQSFQIDTSNGSVAVKLEGDWNGQGVVRSSNGGIDVVCSGRLRCKTITSARNGRVRNETASATATSASPLPIGRLELHTSNGNIDIRQS